jgi:hypothetical protein
LVAQTGHCAPNADQGPNTLIRWQISSWKVKNAIGFTRLRRDFGVAGIAIDRFAGTIVGQQLEEVVE